MKWIKFKFALFVGLAYLFIFGNIFVCAWLNDSMIGTIILLVGFFGLRYVFPKTYHCKKFWYCVIFSSITFWVVVPINLPISVSIFSGIFFGGLIGWVLYKLQDYTDLKLKEFKKKTIFDLTKEELYELMGNSTLTDQEKDAVEYRVIYHYKGQKWYQSVGYSKRNCQYLYKSAVTKLNNLIKQ